MEHVMCNANLEQSSDPNPQALAGATLPDEVAEIEGREEDTTEEIRLVSVTEQPSQVFRNNDGTDAVEALSLRGWVGASRNDRAQLEDYGIDFRDASYDPRARRWNNCLFSEGVATLLRELANVAQFRFPFSIR